VIILCPGCRFPVDESRRQQWAIKVRRLDSTTFRPWHPGPGALLCSKHFLDSDYTIQWGRKLLKPDAVPSVFAFAVAKTPRKRPKNRLPRIPEQNEDNSSSLAAEQEQQSECSSTAKSCSTVSDHQYSIRSPKKLRQTNLMLLEQLHKKSQALRNARRREDRLRGKVCDVLKKLREKHLLSSRAEELLDAYKDIPMSLFKGKCGRSYNKEQKQFATTLHYYSPSAYKYLRQKVRSLPNPRTIRAWLSSFNGEPGLTEQSFATISDRINGTDEWQYRLCALHIDEMEVKKQLEYNRKTGKIHGFVDLGSGNLHRESKIFQL